MAEHNASIDILIPHTIHYTKVENQKESFREFLRSADGIEFRKNSDIDKIFEYGKRFFQEEHFIRDCHSAIEQYKKFNSQMLANKEQK